MARRLLWLALGFCTLAAPCSAQKLSRDSVARAASAMRVIADACPPFGANAEAAEKFFKIFAEAGAEAYGPAFDAALAREILARTAEVERIGVSAWCADEQRRQKKAGAGVLFRSKGRDP